MKQTIAWTRLSLYFGSSLLLLTEGYRLLLILSSFIILAPLLFAILENLILWGLLIGFICLVIGFYRLKAEPTLIDLDENTLPILHRNLVLVGIISIILFVLMLLPPTSSLTEEVITIFSFIVSVLWTVLYLLLVIWLIHYWMFVSDSRTILSILKNKRKFCHLALGIVITIFWLLESFTMIIFQQAVFNISLVNLVYIMSLVFFLLFQSYFFYRFTRFSLRIYG